MKSISLKNRILRYFYDWYAVNPDKWIHKGDICDLARDIGYLPENAGRRLREIVAEGKLSVRMDKNIKSVEYKYEPKI